MAKKKKFNAKNESVDSFMKRRQVETGKIKIKGDKVSPPDSAGSHKTKAKALHQGFVKSAMAKKLEKIAKKKKKRAIGELS